MAGPLIVGKAAGDVAGEVSQVLTGDLVVIRGQVFRAIRRQVPTGELTPTGRPAMVTQEVLVPVDVEAHVNPLSIGLGLAGLGIGLGALALGAWWAGIGVGLLSDQDKTAIEKDLLAWEAIIRANEARIQVLLQLRHGPPDPGFDLAACEEACYAGGKTADAIIRCLDACRAKAGGFHLEEIAELQAENQKFLGMIKTARLKLKVPLRLEKRDRMASSLFRLF